MTPKNDYYEVLGITRDAAHDVIRKAFRKRVRGCHPDRVVNLDEDLRRLAEEKMVRLNEAYAVLRNAARRAAYDDRSSRQSVTTAGLHVTPPRSSTTPPPASGTAVPTNSPPPKHQTLTDPAAARRRIGEQQFVARAASEEFQHTVKRCVTGQVSWTPLAFRGASLALHAKQGRSHLYFVLLAASQLDDRQIQRFLRSLDAFGDKLKSRLFGHDRLFGFAGAVSCTEQESQRSLLERFNEGKTAKHAVQPATLIDLVNWHVVPGETSLETRLQGLLRGR